MAAFIAMTSWEGEVTDEYLAQPAPDPAAFGMPTDDDGRREDPLLSDRSWRLSTISQILRPSRQRRPASGGRGRRAGSVTFYTGRTAIALAEEFGEQATIFPSHHGGFMGGEFGYAGQPDAFTCELREVLNEAVSPSAPIKRTLLKDPLCDEGGGRKTRLSQQGGCHEHSRSHHHDQFPLDGGLRSRRPRGHRRSIH